MRLSAQTCQAVRTDPVFGGEKHKVNIKDEQLARLVCYHPSTDQMINYRIHTNSEGVVIKVEKEKKTKLFIC